MAEEFALEQGFRDGPAVDGNEGAASPPTVAVDDPSDHLLAGSGLSGDAHCGVGLGDVRDLLQQNLHRGAPGHHALQPIELLDQRSEPVDLAAHPLLSQGLLDHELEFLVVEGLGEVAVRSFLHGLDGVGDAPVGGEDQDRQGRMDEPQFLQNHQPVPVRQAEVGDGQVEDLSLGCADGLFAGRARGDGESHGRQPHLEELEQALIVVHDKYAFLRHRFPQGCMSVPAGGGILVGGRMGRLFSFIS